MRARRERAHDEDGIAHERAEQLRCTTAQRIEAMSTAVGGVDIDVTDQQCIVEVEIPAKATVGDTVEVTTTEGIVVHFSVPEDAAPGDVVRIAVDLGQDAAPQPAAEGDSGQRAAGQSADDTTAAREVRGKQPNKECGHGLHTEVLQQSDDDLKWQRKEASFRARLQSWIVKKKEKLQNDPEFRRRRVSEHGSRVQYEAFLNHTAAKKLADAQRAVKTLQPGSDKLSGLQLHDIPGGGSLLLASVDFAQHDIVFMELPTFVVDEQLSHAVNKHQAKGWERSLRQFSATVDAQAQCRILELPCPVLSEEDAAIAHFQDLKYRFQDADRLNSENLWKIPILVQAHGFHLAGKVLLLLRGSQLRHSCCPNLKYRQTGRDIEFRASRDIERGEMLSVDLLGGDVIGAAHRHRRLLLERRISCFCHRCSATDLEGTLLCPSCCCADRTRRSPRADEGYCVRQSATDPVYHCETCGDTFDSEREFSVQIKGTESRATLLVHALMQEIGPENLRRSAQKISVHRQRLDGMYFALIKMVGSLHWTVFVTDLLRLKHALGDELSSSEEIANHMDKSCKWLHRVGLDSVDVLGEELMLLAARKLHTKKPAFPMLAARFCSDVIQFTPQHGPEYMVAVKQLTGSFMDGKKDVRNVSDATNQRPETWGYDGDEPADDDEQEKQQEVRDSSIGVAASFEGDVQASGLRNYIKQCYSMCSDSESSTEMRAALLTQVREQLRAQFDEETLASDIKAVDWSTLQPPMITNGSEAADSMVREFVDGASVVANQNRAEEAEDAEIVEPVHSPQVLSEARRACSPEETSTVEHSVDSGTAIPTTIDLSTPVHQWLQQHGCGGCEGAFEDISTLHDVGLLIASKDDLDFLGLGAEQVECLWPSIQAIDRQLWPDRPT